MVKNFDDILKKGKSKVKVSNKSKKDLFKEYVISIMSSMHKLNDLFENNKHNLVITNGACQKCKKPTFIMTINSLDNQQQAIRLHKSNWKSVGQGIYHCDNCKKG